MWCVVGVRLGARHLEGCGVGPPRTPGGGTWSQRAADGRQQRRSLLVCEENKIKMVKLSNSQMKLISHLESKGDLIHLRVIFVSKLKK